MVRAFFAKKTRTWVKGQALEVKRWLKWLLESFQEIYVCISKRYKTQGLGYFPKIEIVNPVKFIFPLETFIYILESQSPGTIPLSSWGEFAYFRAISCLCFLGGRCSASSCSIQTGWFIIWGTFPGVQSLYVPVKSTSSHYDSCNLLVGEKMVHFLM